MEGISIGKLTARMGLCEEAGPQEAALLLQFEFAHGFRASLGFAVDLLSGLFLGAIFMFPGSLRSGALERKRAIIPGYIPDLFRNWAPSQRPSALPAWVDTAFSPGRP